MSLSKIRKPVQGSTFPMLDDMDNGFQRLDSDEPVEKDATEIELEKMVFGDSSGFHEGLKPYKDASIDSRGLVEGERQQTQSSVEDEKLEDLDDADVCDVELSAGLSFAQHFSSYSSLTRIRPLRIFQTYHLNRPQAKKRRSQRMAMLRHGLIAMTNAWSSP